MTMTMMTKMMTTILFVFSFFLLVAGVKVRCATPVDLLNKLDEIAGNVRPPLPTPILAAAIIFASGLCLPAARLAAAWGCLVRWTNSVTP